MGWNMRGETYGAPVEVLQLPGSSCWDKLKVMRCSIRLQGGVRGADAKRWAEPCPTPMSCARIWS